MGRLDNSYGASLRRYFSPVDEDVRLDDNGFLAVPISTSPPLGTQVWPRRVTDLVDNPSSYVLLAPGGVGKTLTLRSLAEAESHALYVDVSLQDRSLLYGELVQAVASGVLVYLDALDLGTLNNPMLFRVLESVMTTPASSQTKWRLACRTAAWPASFASSLKDSLPDFGEFNLAPLDRSTARAIVTEAGFDGNGFIEAFIQAGRGRLSASPQRLLAAARHWHTKGTLPENHLGAIEFEVRQFLAETDDIRSPQLAADSAFTIAKRLAAFACFAGTQTITTGPTSNAVSTSIVDLPSGPEPDQPGNRIDPDKYREVLDTALFTARASGDLVFRHQQYAEFLAASYLVDRGVTQSQLPALLGLHANGVLPGARIGVAAWCAALQPTIAASLIQNNSRALIAASVELPTDETRALIVQDLLAQAAADLEPEWSLDLSGLTHSRLVEQLRTLFDAGLASANQLWWVCRLAAASECHAIADLIAQQALDSAWPAWVRSVAVRTAAGLHDQAARNSLRALIHMNPEDDQQDELLAATIDALYSDVLATNDLLRMLRPAQTPHYTGGYDLCLSDLAQRIPIDDLPMVLGWFANRLTDSLSDTTFDRFYREIVRRAWTERRVIEVHDALAECLTATADSRYWTHHGRRTGSFPWLSINPDPRRELAVAVAERTPANSSYRVVTLALVTHKDLEWLLERLPSLPPRAHPALAGCLSPMLGAPTAAIADRVLAMDTSHPAFEATAWAREPVDITSPAFQAMRNHAASTQRFQDQQTQRAAQLAEQVASTLVRLESDLSAWWQVLRLISTDDNGDISRTIYGHDLYQRPGWDLLSVTQQDNFIIRGLEYLREHQLAPENRRLSTTVAIDQVLPDWSGVYLMTTLLKRDPLTLRSLGSDIWCRWAPAIVAAWNSDVDDDQHLRTALLRAVPDTARHDIAQAALDHLDDLSAADQAFNQYTLYDELIGYIAPTIAHRLVARAYTISISADLLNLLSQHAPELAVQACFQLRNDPTSPLAAVAAEQLAALDPNQAVDDLVARQPMAADLVSVAGHLRVDRLDLAHLFLVGERLLGER